MLRPSERWNWTYCSTKDRLLLDISDELQFCSPFAGRQLQHLPQCQPLSMAEAEAFWLIDDVLQPLELAPAIRLELALTALSCAFLQQQAHKSWYFQAGIQCDAKQYQLVTIRGLSTQLALVVAAEDECVFCLLLGELTTLAGKVLPRLHVVRVLRNRITAHLLDLPLRCTA